MMIIGIAGGTGSGKTRLAKQIQEAFGNQASLIEQDCYYKDLSDLPLSERAKKNFDHPTSLDFELLQTHLLQLKAWQPIYKPHYDFKTHSRTQDTTLVFPTKIVIIEGILLLSIPNIRELLDLKIYVEAEDDIRILRRLERDIKERGRDFTSIKEQYLKTVKPMHSKFVEPIKIYADVIIPSHGDNSQALQMIISRLKDAVDISF
ncbi:uridine kinase [Parachlamydia acanthamoebae]|uniref:uridine kinase n=1 Tax=Parachlamydia acanthamoebae TaxID=83552 RepID=UPI001D049A9F|nr:uridine kinase [Parachlamydia acanthamoebae]